MQHRCDRGRRNASTPPATAEFVFDFGGPNANFGHKLIPAIEASTRKRFTHVPILLGGQFKLANNRSPVQAFAALPNKRADDAEVAAVLTADGLDTAAIAAKSLEPEVKSALLANTERAHARGAFGWPSFFVGDELWFGKERLRDVKEALLARISLAASARTISQGPRRHRRKSRRHAQRRRCGAAVRWSPGCGA